MSKRSIFNVTGKKKEAYEKKCETRTRKFIHSEHNYHLIN